jgi:hypothetical protein
MSTQIGTLQPKAGTIQPMWPVAILALLVVAIVAAIVFAPEGSRPRQETTVGSTADVPVSTGISATHGKQLGIGIAFPQPLTGTAANTPTELTGGIAFSTAGAVTSAPAELSGRFLAERAKQLGSEIGTTGTPATTTGGGVCDICWKYR